MKLIFTACCLVTLFLTSLFTAGAVPILTLTQSNRLLRFESTTPFFVPFIQSQTSVTGLQPGEKLLAIDFRPSNGQLYGITDSSRLYLINPNTGAATQVGSGSFSPPFPSGAFDIDFDFDPITDLIRVVTPNLRLNPDTGVVVAVDNPIAFAAGDPNAGRAASVSGAAYSNNFSGATSTTVYVITNLSFTGQPSILATLGSLGGTPVSPNTGQLFTVANVGGIFKGPAGLDIAPDGTAYALISGTDTFNMFFTVNLSTGALNNFATFGLNRELLDLAVVLPNSESPAGTFQFSAPSFSVNEDAHSVTVTVTRTGNTSIPATIDLTTLDDSANQKSDYIIALRRLEFGPGETSKSVKILIVDDVFFDPSESFKVVLSNATGGFIPASPDSVSVSIVDNDFVTVQPPPNPLGDPQFFVRQHYADFLNREPDPGGLNFWVNQITSCGSDQQCIEIRRINVSAAFFLSIEFQKTGVIAYLTHRITGGVGSLPRYLDFMRDVQALQKDFVFGAPGADAQLEANTQAFFNDVVNLEGFVESFGFMTNAQYVDRLILNTAVPFSQAERDALVNGLNNQTETRATVLRKLVENPAFKQAEFNKAFVLMEYFGYLRRDPGFEGFNFWLNKLNSFNGNFINAEMVKAFITSIEYRSRFGTP
jgi:uncharacterized protein DUF4394/Calx-beta domain-containing protein/uncharacterized protein DUF4214